MDSGVCRAVLIVATLCQGPAPQAGPAIAARQCHDQVWSHHVDPYGIVRDFVGELPTPEDCRLGRPNAIGWWSPIENGPMLTGLWLGAVCERARRSGDPVDIAHARRLAAGLMKCASVSETPGFIARGVGTDGRCHYPMGSDDQTHPWFLGLCQYVESGLAVPDEQQTIRHKLVEVATILQAHGWRCPCDGAFAGQFRGGYRGRLFRDAVRYLSLLRMIADISNDSVWLDRYQSALHEIPDGADRTRQAIVAQGYPADRDAIPNLDEGQLWIYVGCQATLRDLLSRESAPAVRDSFQKGLLINAIEALRAVAASEKFENQDQRVFGNARWRRVYAEWNPQSTQGEAEELARRVNVALRGERKPYETRWMRNPLAGAAIVALALPEVEPPADARTQIERAIMHYDYTRLNMAEMLFAEVAYFAMPSDRP